MKYLIPVLLLLCACKKDNPQNVQYSVTCNSCSVTYTDKDQHQQQASANGQWTYSFIGNSGDPVALKAQNTVAATAVTSTISLDGSTFKTLSVNGLGAIASVSGTIP